MADSTKPLYSLAGKRVWISGHGGMVGSALMRRLQSEDCKIFKATSKELDLRRQAEVEAWMEAEKPETVFLAAATVGGIMANDTRPAEFMTTWPSKPTSSMAPGGAVSKSSCS